MGKEGPCLKTTLTLRALTLTLVATNFTNVSERSDGEPQPEPPAAECRPLNQCADPWEGWLHRCGSGIPGATVQGTIGTIGTVVSPVWCPGLHAGCATAAPQKSCLLRFFTHKTCSLLHQPTGPELSHQDHSSACEGTRIDGGGSLTPPKPVG